MPNATVRANVQAMPIDRRAAISGLAALGALLAVPRAAKAALRTSRVSSAYAAFRSAWEASLEANDNADAVEARFRAPDRPEFIYGVDLGNRIESPGERAVIDVSDGNANVLLCLLSAPRGVEGRDVSEQVRRIESTLEKIETFHAEVRRRRDAAGLLQAEAAADEARERAYRAAEVVLSLDAESVADLAMQADVALKREFDEDATRVLNRLIAFAGLVSPHASLASPAHTPAASSA